MARFLPGESGNPGGRPKVVAEVQALARKHTADAISTLAKIMRDTKAPPAARVSAASVILDRGYGKAVQSIETNEGTSFVVGTEAVSREQWLTKHGNVDDQDQTVN